MTVSFDVLSSVLKYLTEDTFKSIFPSDKTLILPRCVGQVYPKPDLDLVAFHGGEDHGRIEEVLRLHLRVVPLVERRLECEELAADLGGNSIDICWLKFWLEKWLEIQF